MALRSDDFSINTVIGEGSTVSGDLRINGSVRLDGDVRGDLETDGNVQIGERARLCGNLTAKSAIIGGIVLGCGIGAALMVLVHIWQMVLSLAKERFSRE